MARQDTKLESEGAEFLVLGQLLIEGITAYKMYIKQRGYDLVAIWPETNRVARIQVKSRWATTAPHFLIKNVDDCDFIILVRLKRGKLAWAPEKTKLLPEDPEYYVLTAKEAKNRLARQGPVGIRFGGEETTSSLIAAIGASFRDSSETDKSQNLKA